MLILPVLGPKTRPGHWLSPATARRPAMSDELESGPSPPANNALVAPTSAPPARIANGWILRQRPSARAANAMKPYSGPVYVARVTPRAPTTSSATTAGPAPRLNACNQACWTRRRRSCAAAVARNHGTRNTPIVAAPRTRDPRDAIADECCKDQHWAGREKRKRHRCREVPWADPARIRNSGALD